MIRRMFSRLLFTMALGTTASPAHAIVTTWTVQSSSSSLSISGALSSSGLFVASVTAQGGGGLTANYDGTIDTRQTVVPVATDGGSGTPESIELLAANLTALNSGSWDPLPLGLPGAVPANYGPNLVFGALGRVNLAIRGLSVDLSSAATALSGIAYDTQSANPNLTVTLLSATVDFFGSGPLGDFLFGYGSLTSGVASQSSTVVAGTSIEYSGGGQTGTATLTIPLSFPVSLVFSGGDTTGVADDLVVYLSMTGQIVATAATSTVPEANSLVLLGLAGSAVGFVGYRRRMRHR